MTGGPFRGPLMRQLAEAAAPAVGIPAYILAGEPSREAHETALSEDRAERYRRTVETAAVDDARRDAERKGFGLPWLGPSIVLTPEQTDALHAGSLDLADVLRPDQWADLFASYGIDIAPHPDRAVWALPSLFTLKPGEHEWRRWHRGPNGPRACKRRADRKRSDRKRRARRGNNPHATGAIRARNEKVSERSAPIPD